MSHFTAIILSAGAGRRMNSEIPKQYLPLKGKPVIYYSLQAFEQSVVDDIILVCGAGDEEYCRKEIVERFHIKKVKAIVPGGAERYDSVFAGLKAAEGADYVLIHDGARPLVTEEIIRRSMDAVRADGACVVGMPVKDTIKVADGLDYAVDTPDRNTLWLVQTPQTFSYPLIYEAYSGLLSAGENEDGAAGQDGEEDDISADKDRGKMPVEKSNVSLSVTDDAMVVEAMTGHKVKLIRGSYTNLKITTPEDLLTAELFLEKSEFCC